ncbi:MULTISPECIES: calcium-binding protein [Rhizobium]|uniref:Putative nodulation protein n=1 Tax=Rhizobium esperanzae TaxID=1967781 RepID=A0A7W6UNN6_9HYPH|nr:MULTISPECIES: calcium-binding protein [Rhizobium]ASS60173.1 nodulation protein NodO [Rhizobium leguminosarum bv. viciae]MBB4343214.1 putative nodulation protein [Rhizobium leguminosarum]MBB4441505.1 putative nodulation protein [Rhizobium esperanzae]MBB5261076.1 putative nodulation protein [Rhizobium leguminosarum]MBB6296292.1 putative nodulation protein [Rhizobium leguminosarum]
MNIKGSDKGGFIWGSNLNDTIDCGKKNDWIDAGDGDDRIKAGDGQDYIMAGPGHDTAYGGNGSDVIHADGGDDLLYSDASYPLYVTDPHRVIPHSGEGDDVLDAGPGRDILVAGDGADVLTGGDDGDAFVFRFHNPMVGTTHCYTSVMDFDTKQDRFVLDAADFGGDRNLFDANFINHSKGFPGEFVDTFYNGAAEGAHGEHVVVITDRGFASAAAAATAIDHEAPGDIIVYHDEKTLGQDGKTHGATLAYVDSANHAHAFAHVDNLHDMSDLTSLTAENFGFI